MVVNETVIKIKVCKRAQALLEEQRKAYQGLPEDEREQYEC